MEKVMSVKELAVYLHVHQSFIYRMIKRNVLPHFKVGSDYRFREAAIDQWIKEQEDAN